MPGDDYKKVTRGQKLSGLPMRLYNDLVDLARPSSTGSSWEMALAQFDSGIVKVKNISGADQRRNAVLGIGAPITLPSVDLDEFRTRVTFEGDTPSADDHSAKFVVLLEPIAAGGIGLAVIDGVAQVQVIWDDGTPDFADVTDGDSSALTSAAAGSARVLWVEDSGDVRWAIVRIEANSNTGEGTPPAATITVETVDGVPSYGSIDTIRVDEADGFSLTNPSAGVARLDLLSASTTQKGIVDLTSQIFAGVKGFNDGLDLELLAEARGIRWLSGDADHYGFAYTDTTTDETDDDWGLRIGIQTAALDSLRVTLYPNIDDGVLTLLSTIGGEEPIYAIGSPFSGPYYDGIYTTNAIGDKFAGGIIYERGDNYNYPNITGDVVNLTINTFLTTIVSTGGTWTITGFDVSVLLQNGGIFGIINGNNPAGGLNFVIVNGGNVQLIGGANIVLVPNQVNFMQVVPVFGGGVVIIQLWGGGGANNAGILSPLTTKGDIWVFSNQDTRLAVGADGVPLQANSAVARGLSYGAVDYDFNGKKLTNCASPAADTDATTRGWVKANVGNPTASVSTAAVNGVATTFMRSDAAPAIDQGMSPTWTGVHTWNAGTASAQSIIFDMADLVANGQRDSHYMRWRGTSYDGSAHQADWKFFIDVTSNAGASTYTVQRQLDGGGYASKFTVTDASIAGATIFDAVTGFRIGGAAASAHYLRGDGTDYIDGTIQSTDVPDMGANPTATIGLAAVNGTATRSYIRSDGAPALSQAIAPTWTGLHAWKYENATTNAADTILTIGHNTSDAGGSAANFGLKISYQLETTTTADTDVANLTVTWATATHASRKGRAVYNVFDTAARECLRMEASGSAPMISFLGAAASAALASPDLATLATTFGLATGSPTLAESKLTFTDITTGNASTSNHGFLKKLSNVATEYMDGSGSWSVPGTAAAVNYVQTARLTGNYTNATNSFTDVDEDSGGANDLQFSVAANKEYEFEFVLRTDCNNTGGSLWQLTGPSSPTQLFTSYIATAGSAAAFVTSATVTAFSSQSGIFNTFNGTGAATAMCRIRGYLRNGSNAGTVLLQMKSNTNTQTTTVYSGSFVVARQLT